jgi:capsular exopolysaccharide synthesis family protein
MVKLFMETARATGSVRSRDLHVVEPAAPPLKAAFPNKMRITLLMAIFGIILASSTAFLFEYRDNTLKSVEDVQQCLGLPMLTIVPEFKSRQKQPALLLGGGLDSPLAEAYRVLRTRLQFSQPAGSLRTFLIVSPLSWEEKASVAINMAVVMTYAGLKVLLVDADLRRPQLHKIFDLPREPGLSTLLAETDEAQPYITETGIPNLRLLTSGSPCPDPLLLLNLPRLPRLVTRLKEQADVVLFTAPPLLAVADAMVLAAHLDGTMLVLQSRTTQRQSAGQALKMLRNVDANVLGTVLTKVRVRPARYHYYSDFSKPLQQIQALPRSQNGRLEQKNGIMVAVSEPKPPSDGAKFTRGDLS